MYMYMSIDLKQYHEGATVPSIFRPDGYRPIFIIRHGTFLNVCE